MSGLGCLVRGSDRAATTPQHGTTDRTHSSEFSVTDEVQTLVTTFTRVDHAPRTSVGSYDATPNPWHCVPIRQEDEHGLAPRGSLP